MKTKPKCQRCKKEKAVAWKDQQHVCTKCFNVLRNRWGNEKKIGYKFPTPTLKKTKTNRYGYPLPTPKVLAQVKEIREMMFNERMD